jgi:DNA-binding transcriptional ArsR family regulator
MPTFRRVDAGVYLADMELKELERLLKALANKRRLAILRYLKRHGEANVTGIAEVIKLSVKSTSRHLAVLSAVNLVDRRQMSLEVYYWLSPSVPPPIKGVISIL